MALIVQKFGGSSVGTIDRIRNVARRIHDTAKDGNQVVAVVSAMSGVTDKLIGLAKELSESPCERELDVLMATGEQQSIALLCMALHELDAGPRGVRPFRHRHRGRAESGRVPDFYRCGRRVHLRSPRGERRQEDTNPFI